MGGTFGRVRQVRLLRTDDSHPPPLALKMMRKTELVKFGQIEHVKAEKNILMTIDCPFVVTYLSTFQDEYRLYLLMEYVHGGELFTRLRDEGRIPTDHAKFY